MYVFVDYVFIDCVVIVVIVVIVFIERIQCADNGDNADNAIKARRNGDSVGPLYQKFDQGLFFLLYEALLDAGLLAGEVAQVVEFRATYLTELVDSD